MVRQKLIRNYFQSDQGLVKMFTLKMGMIQTGLLVRFGQRPLNKFQLKGKG